MESIVKDCISNITGVCRICNQKIILSSDDDDDIHQQSMINHYLDCVNSFKSVLLNINNSRKHVDHSNNLKHVDDNLHQDILRRKRKKISSMSSSSTSIPSSSTNHYFQDSLLRISMISILYREDDNESVMNLLMTCKDAMKWKDTVVFPRLPSINTIESYKNNGRINQLPRRYNRVDIENRDYFKKNVDGLINHHCRELNYFINDPIPAGFIPDHFTKIQVCGRIEVGSIPPFTTHLLIGSSRYPQEIYKELFPDTLEMLDTAYGVIGEHSNLDDLVPHNIKVLYIASNLVHPYLLKLKNLYLMTTYDIQDGEGHGYIRIGNIPKTIEYLYLNNCTVESGYTLPSSIKYFSINLTKNSPQCIPSSVKYLFLVCQGPTVLLKGWVPSSVTDLRLDGQFQLTIGSIPSSVITLSLTGFDVSPHASTIPDSVNSLIINGLDCQFDATLYTSSIKYFGMLGKYPFSIKSCIPPSTNYFDYQSSYISQWNANDIPNGVTHIRLELITGFIPDSCEYLELSYIYNEAPLWKAVPKQLKTIRCNPKCSVMSKNIPASINQTPKTRAHEGGSTWDANFRYLGLWRKTDCVKLYYQYVFEVLSVGVSQKRTSERNKREKPAQSRIEPTPKILPPPFFLVFHPNCKKSGPDIWSMKRFDVESTIVQRGGQTYHLPAAHVDFDFQGELHVRMMLKEQPKGPMPH
ncbi:hypothetical protein DFA_11316 [Cavenderia fasciculata]|uniref:FNIP repeat-containing protein n=1 Tax=Cavenderia fasciculata TaxID=261658 RepID=F4QC68_CACFS|nr:uncharacterized protein DFA_11316 [Cavenderia fasciculata]EGG13555.1 hypothetical protein DFA_11316 [Cavenderia fasciculata]|eukprot:XP_004350259.1 hypothetical protein DFA_11316 [Cavenderia fasciculata]